MEVVAEIMRWTRVLIELGWEVYKAAKSGDTSKTVGEILDGRQMDLDVLAELEAKARAKFPE